MMDCSYPYDGMTPLEIFRKIAFELKSYPDDVVQAHIELAQAMYCCDAYGEAANLFLALMAAHLMVIPGGIAASSGTGSAPDGVKSLKEGDLQIVYQDTGTTDTSSVSAWLNGSRFGKLIIQLKRTYGVGGTLLVGQPGVNLCPTGYYFPNRAIH